MVTALALQWGFILGRGFDGLYGQDAFAYYDYALQIWENVRYLRPPPPFYWPLGYPALVAALFSLVGSSPLAGQLVSSLAGAGVVLLSYLLARDLLVREGLPVGIARWAGVVASLLVATSGQLWQWSIAVMADAPALFWATLAAWALVRYGRTWRLPWLLLSAFALAWAVMTRWIYGLLAIPFGAYWLLESRQRARMEGEGEVASCTPRLPHFIHHVLFAGLVGVVVLAPQLAFVVAFHTPVLSHQWLVRWSPLNALRSTFVTVDGYASYPLPVALFYAKAVASPRYLFPLLTPFLFLGLGTIIRRRWWRAAALLMGWGGIVYAFLGGIPYQNFRFTLTFLPAQMILTAIGLRQAWDWLAPRRRPLLLIYLLMGMVGGLSYSARVLNEFIARKEADLAVVRWVEAQIPDNARLLTFGLTLTFRHYSTLETLELFELAPAEMAELLREGDPVFLLIDVANVEEQWRGRAPEVNYRWLREGPGLEKLGAQHGYVLFRVGKANGGEPDEGTPTALAASRSPAAAPGQTQRPSTGVHACGILHTPAGGAGHCTP